MTLVFTVPQDGEATAPPERSGLPRDGVRLMAVRPSGVTHARFRDLPSGRYRAADLAVAAEAGR